ncbi:hypothetical protein JZ751_028796 [Albula glossodonta]|uniref:PAT complex subunit Asterix n=1 Tax=Albula glossodonta TaxID=121402 RepID=A0A8T2NC20_9TELE|nr:hypothetical protein JZ751_028796 [Albula glossodonta]
MTSNSMSDPRRQNKILRYKPPSTDSNPTLEDPTPDYMNLLGMIFSMCGLMLKLKWCAWIAVYCSFISFANSRSSEDTKQMMSSFITPSQCRRHGNLHSDSERLQKEARAIRLRSKEDDGQLIHPPPSGQLGKRDCELRGDEKTDVEFYWISAAISRQRCQTRAYFSHIN